MSKTNFRKADLKRAYEAARDLHVKVTRIEVDKDGKIALVTENAVTEPAAGNAAEIVL